MNLSHEELEKELASLKPVSPSKALRENIQSELEDSDKATTTTIIRFWPIVALAAAACFALILALQPESQSEDQESAQPALVNNLNEQAQSAEFSGFEPVEAEQRLMEAFDDGIVFTSDNKPVRKLRYQFIDAVTLVNQDDGSVYRVEVPREEILLVPVTLI